MNYNIEINFKEVMTEIKKNIYNYKYLFQRGHTYQRIEIDKTFPKYIIDNKKKLKNWII